MHVASILLVLFTVLLTGALLGNMIIVARQGRSTLGLQITSAILGGLLIAFATEAMTSLDQGVARTACEPTTHTYVWLDFEQTWKCIAKEEAE